MNVLTPLAQIPVPEPRPDQVYTMTLLDRPFTFTGLKRLLGAADATKSGDRIAGLAAADEVTREAARAILSSLTVQHLHDHPLTDDKGQVDSVMRVNYDIDRAAFDRDVAQIRRLTPGPVRRTIRRVPALVSTAGDAISKLGLGPRMRTWINREDPIT